MTNPLDNPILADNECRWNTILLCSPRVSIVGPTSVIQCEPIVNHFIPGFSTGGNRTEKLGHNILVLFSDSDETHLVTIFALQLTDEWHPDRTGAAPSRSKLGQRNGIINRA
jgi:hypothetical protein